MMIREQLLAAADVLWVAAFPGLISSTQFLILRIWSNGPNRRHIRSRFQKVSIRRTGRRGSGKCHLARIVGLQDVARSQHSGLRTSPPQNLYFLTPQVVVSERVVRTK
jgi:hypothetical protein